MLATAQRAFFKSNRMPEFLTIVGGLFDAVQVAVQIGAVCTDYLLLYEWWYQGDEKRGFFWALLSACCCAAVFAATALAMRARLRYSSVAASYGDPKVWTIAGSTHTRASAELFGSLLKQHRALGTLDEAIVTRVNGYMGIMVYFLVESVSSALFQLVAASITGNLSHISLIFSLSSIALKSFIVARSFCPRVTAFKIACIVLDVFLLVYLFSSVLHTADLEHGIEVVNVSSNTSWKLVNRSVPAPAANSSNMVLTLPSVATLLITPLSFGWVIAKMLSSAMLVVSLWYPVAYVLADEGYRGRKYAPVVLIGSVLLQMWGNLVQTCFHASAIAIVCIFVLEPSGVEFPAAGFVHSWLWSVPSTKQRAVVVDWRRTLRKMQERSHAAMEHARKTIAKLEVGVAFSGSAQHAGGRILATLPWQYRSRSKSGERNDDSRSALQFWQQPYVGSKRLTIEDDWHSRVHHLRCVLIYHNQERALRAFSNAVVESCRTAQWQWELADRLARAVSDFEGHRVSDGDELSPDARSHDVPLSSLIISLVEQVADDADTRYAVRFSFFWATLSCVVSTLCSAAFTVAHALLYWHNDTLIARVSFGVVCVAALVMLVTAAPFLRYCRTCILFREGSLKWFLDASNAAAAIDLWNSFPLSLCGQAVPSDIVPSDALENHVLTFLTVEHCLLHGIPNSEFASAMTVFRESMPAVLDPEEMHQQVAAAPPVAAPSRVVDEIDPDRLARDSLHLHDNAPTDRADLPEKRDNGDLCFTYSEADGNAAAVLASSSAAASFGAAPLNGGENSPLLANVDYEYEALQEHESTTKY